MKGLVLDFTNGQEIGEFVYCDGCGNFMLLPAPTEKCPICNAEFGEELKYALNADKRVYWTTCTSADMHKQGFLVLRIDEKVEYEDCETGVLHEIEIFEFCGDFFKAVEYGDNGEICSEWEIPYSVYVSQLQSIGATDAYPMLEL